MFWDIFGIFAGLIATCSFVPQIIKGIKTKKLDDLSYFMLFFLSTGMALWIVYGIHLSSFPIIFANSVGILFNIILIYLKRNYSKRL